MGRGGHTPTVMKRQTPHEPSHLESPCDKGRGPNKTGMFIRHEVRVRDKQSWLSSEPTGPHFHQQTPQTHSKPLPQLPVPSFLKLSLKYYPSTSSLGGVWGGGTWPSPASQSSALLHNGSIMEGHREKTKELLDRAMPEVQV